MIKVELNMVLNMITEDSDIQEINASKMVEMPICPVVGMKIGLRDVTGRICGELEVTTVYWEEGRGHIEAYFSDHHYHRKQVIEPIIANGWK